MHIGVTKRYITKLCAVIPKKLVLMIDEVDSAVNNQVFLDFGSRVKFFI